MRTNQKPRTPPARNHHGQAARTGDVVEQLTRSVMSCLLWEKTFYEEGEDIAARISRLAMQAPEGKVHEIAVAARNEAGLRHAPLLLALALIRRNSELAVATIQLIVQRPDDATELLNLYFEQEFAARGKKIGKDGMPIRPPLANKLKRGLGLAMGKFDAYQLAKYSRRTNAVNPRDVLRLTHPMPRSEEQSTVWQALVYSGEHADPVLGSLPPAETWESEIVKAVNKVREQNPDASQTVMEQRITDAKRKVIKGLLAREKIGYLAALRNLRNWDAWGVDRDLIKDRLLSVPKRFAPWPHQYIQADLATNKRYRDTLNEAMRRAAEQWVQEARLPGTTHIMIDVSYSMNAPINNGGGRRGNFADLLGPDRIQASAGLAALIREVCDDVKLYSFSNDFKVLRTKARHLDLVDHYKSLDNAGTSLYMAMTRLLELAKGERVIVITDEQATDGYRGAGGVKLAPGQRGYLINVAPYGTGIKRTKDWVYINGWSQSILKFIKAEEEGVWI